MPASYALFGVNYLELATLSATPDGAVTGKPLSRLADRAISLETEDPDVGGTRTWSADLGPTPPTDASVAIFLGRAVAGVLVTLESSTDAVTWTARGTVTPTADETATILAVTGAPVTARYWRWSVTDPAAPVRWLEVFLSPPGVALTWNPAASALTEPTLPNVVLVESVSGERVGVRRGARRWGATYTIAYAAEADRLAVFAFMDDILDGASPFWLRTVQGEYRWVRLDGGVVFAAADRTADKWDIPLVFTEELR